MKRFTTLLFISLILLLSCSLSGEISYKIVNETDYDVVVIDNYVIPVETYNIPANNTITIKHYNSAKFELQNTEYPIKIYNGFDTAYIRDLPKYDFQVINYTQKNYVLKILNSEYQPTTFSIDPDSSFTIHIYVSKPDIELLYDNNSMFNYMIQDNKIIIL